MILRNRQPNSGTKPTCPTWVAPKKKRKNLLQVFWTRGSSRSLYTSFIMILFFHTGVPLGQFFDFLCTGSQSPMGQIPNFLSHQAFREVLNHGLATAHRNITFVICDILTEFRQPLQVQSHLEMPRILVQLGHTQRTWKLAPQTDPKWSPTWSLQRFQPICPLIARDGRYACQVSRAHCTHSRL